MAERLRDGQLPVVEALLEYIGSHSQADVKGYIVAPTGSGKTVIMATMLEELRLRGELPRTFITVPTRKLVDQTYHELIARGFKGDVRMLKTGSIRDEGQGDVIIGTQAAFARHTSHKPAHAMYAIDPQRYGLLIFDEAHHLQGESTQMALDQHFRHAAKLGFTATDDYDEKRLLSNILPDKIFEIFTRDAVEQGLIAPYVTGLLATPADMSRVRVVGKEFDQYSLERALNTEVRNYAIAKFASEKLAGRKILFNVGRIHHAEALTEALRHFGIPAVAVHGGQKESEFNKILEKYRDGTIQALAQARILGEGYDDPSIEVVVNVTPTLSWVREKQRTGRGQRINPEDPEKTLLVIECVDHNYQRRPVLYGHPEVTGEWHVVPKGINPSFKSFLTELGDYNNGAVRFTSDQETIEEWQTNTRSLDSLFPDSKGTVELHNGDVVPIKLTDLVPKPFEPEREKSSPGSLRVPQISEKQRRVQEAMKSLRERRNNNSDDEADEEEEQPSSAYEQLDTLRPESRAIAEYILNGTATQMFRPADTRLALKTVAGKLELLDPDVLNRYREVNGRLRGDDVDRSDAISSEQKRLGENIIRFLTALAKPGLVDNTDANCKGLGADRFFTERGESTRPAREVCSNCKIRETCADHAIAKEHFGVWGDLSERERRRIRRRLAREIVIHSSTEEDSGDIYSPSNAEIEEAESLFGVVAAD